MSCCWCCSFIDGVHLKKKLQSMLCSQFAPWPKNRIQIISHPAGTIL